MNAVFLRAPRPVVGRPVSTLQEAIHALPRDYTIVMATRFTSDTHFGHENIIRYCGRPFVSDGEMNYVLTQRWNEVVAPEDTVYHLGDFAMGPTDLWAGCRSALKGRITLILGNHDRDTDFMRNVVGFNTVESNVIVDVEGVALWLNHYPIATKHDLPKHWQRPDAPGEYDVALCGHIHEKWRTRAGCVHVGVDVWDFRPVSLTKILAAVEVDLETALHNSR